MAINLVVAVTGARRRRLDAMRHGALQAAGAPMLDTAA
jgi:hypothetical protein